ncbi:MAG: tetratricopeptide repeat protein [Planctomycetota bacterium]
MVRKCSFALLLTWAATGLGSVEPTAVVNEMDGKSVDFVAFRKAVEASDDPKAISIGDSILKRLEQKYRNDAGFVDYKSKLNTAEFLASQMEAWLRKATRKQTLSLAPGLLDKTEKDDNEINLATAPAKTFSETSVKLFSKPIQIAGLEDKEKAFLARYYDLKLRLLTSAIAQAGRALTVTDPDFDGTHDYVLVLPLLHALDEKPLNIDVLPRWMQHPSELSMFSDSCLLHFGLPFRAMTLAKESAHLQNKRFSVLDFYKAAARKCWQSRPHVAADCLHRAINQIREDDQDTIVGLQFELVQLWMDSQNYSLAAGHARKIFETAPDHEQAGEAIWLYLYCLSQCRDTDTILAHVDWALSDKRCRAYESRLMYIKWFALRSKGKDPVRLMAVEHKLMKRYGNDPMVAPVLLFQGTRLMAGGDYESAREPLARLVEKFPSTKAAVQAKRILERLK